MTEPDRDAEVTRRYRALDREEPARALDEAILSAACGAVETHPAPLVAPTARRRWYVPLAAAAVIVLSVVVTLQMQREPSDGESMVPPAPSPPAGQEEAAPAAPPAAAVPKAEATRDAATESRVAAPVKAEPQRMTREPRAVSVPPPSAARLPSPAPVPQPFQERRIPGTAESEGAAAAPVGRAAPAPEDRGAPRQAIQGDRPGRMAADALSKPAEEAEPPERWLERIAALRREGRAKEADELYTEFRRRYPGYRIPDAMREQVLPR